MSRFINKVIHYIFLGIEWILFPFRGKILEYKKQLPPSLTGCILFFLRKMHINKTVGHISLKKVLPVSNMFGFDRGTPIDRYYIDQFLEANAHYIKGNILEIADSNYSRQYAQDGENDFFVLTLDTPPAGEKLLKGDLTSVDALPEGVFDCFICTQTFNFIYDVKAAIKGAHKLLKDGGTLLATVTGISQISRYDMDRWGDYWRFTNLSIQKLMEEEFLKENVQIIVYGNALSATSLIQGLAVEDIKNRSLLDKSDNNYQVTIGIVAKK